MRFGGSDRRLRIGLTGGVASGKSTVAAAFVRRGVPVLDADAAARDVTARGSAGLAALVAEHGAPLRPDGELDRAALRDRLFRDPALRAGVEATLHPLILERLTADGAAARGPYLVYAVPLIAERGLAGDFHRILVVDCPEPLQIERLMRRDGIDESAARRMLAAQASRAERRALADDVVLNDGDLAALDAAVDRLHARYLELSSHAPFPRHGRGGENSGP